MNRNRRNMDHLPKPKPSWLKPATQKQAAAYHQKVDSFANKPNLSSRHRINVTDSQRLQSLPAQNQMPIKHEPWEGPTNLSPPVQVKPMLTYHRRAPPLRPTLQIPRLNTMPNTSTPKNTPLVLKRKQPTSSGPIIKKLPLDHFVCQLCQLSFSSGITLQQHLRGQSHKAKMEFTDLTKDKKAPALKLPQLNTSTPTRTTPGGLNEEQPSSSRKKPPLDDLGCGVCQVSCSSGLTLSQHLRGRPHKAKMKFMELKRRGQGKPRCDVCQIWCSDRAALEMHFNGQKHKSNVQELEMWIERGGQKSSSSSPKEMRLCELCCVPCMNQDCYEMHLKGRKHAQKLVELNHRGSLL